MNTPFLQIQRLFSITIYSTSQCCCYSFASYNTPISPRNGEIHVKFVSNRGVSSENAKESSQARLNQPKTESAIC